MGKKNVLIIAILGIAAASLVYLAINKSTFSNDSKVEEAGFKAEITDKVRKDDPAKTIRMSISAMISPKRTRIYYEDLLNLIGKRLSCKIVFIQRKTYGEINDLIEQREIDVAFVCSGPYVAGHKKFGMELLVLPVSNGKKVYHSYILAHINSPINSFNELKGKRFAFTDSHSNTGCLVPKYMLAERGETPESFFSEAFYSYSHDNSIQAVAEKLADGAAVDGLIWDFLNKTDPEYTSKTKIVEKSPPYGIPPVVVHPDTDPELKKQLRDIFLTLHETEEGEKILAELQIDRFETGDDSMYNSVREMQEWLKNQEK